MSGTKDGLVREKGCVSQTNNNEIFSSLTAHEHIEMGMRLGRADARGSHTGCGLTHR